MSEVVIVGQRPRHYLDDLTTTDRRDPTLNAYGPIYGDTELSSNAQPVLDPVQQHKDNAVPKIASIA